MKTKKFLTNLYSVFFLWFLIPSILMGCGTVEVNTVQSVTDNSNTVGIGSTLESSSLAAYLKIQDSFQQGSGEPIIMHFSLENHTQDGLYLLKWYTPLEGIGGDIFDVTRDGQPIPYLGPDVSRTVPTPEAYIFIESGKGVTSEVDIGAAYDFSKPGIYTIQYRSPRISHLAWSEEEMATSFDELGPVNISSNEVTLEVVASPGSQME